MLNDQLTANQSLCLCDRIHQCILATLKSYLHVTTGDEAFVLHVTHLKKLQSFLLDSVAPHIFGLRGIRRLAVASSLPRSSHRWVARVVVVSCCRGGGSAGKRWSRHGFGECVALRVFPSVHMSRVRLSCGTYRSWRIPGCSTSEPLSTVTDSHLLATTYVISRWNKERDSRRGFLIKSSPRKRDELLLLTFTSGAVTHLKLTWTDK